MCPAGASLPPGTHTIPLSQLQTHSLAIQCPQTQNSHAMTSTTTTAAVPAHTQPAAQATLFRLPATVSLTGQCVSYSVCFAVLRETELLVGAGFVLLRITHDLHATAFINVLVMPFQVTKLMQKINNSSKIMLNVMSLTCVTFVLFKITH